MKRNKILTHATALLAVAALGACGVSSAQTQSSNSTVAASSATGTTSTSAATAASGTAVAALADNKETHADADDAQYVASEASAIRLADGASTTTAASGVSIDKDVITISAPGTYVVSGRLSNGQIVVNSAAEGKVRIVLAGASITSSTGSPFVVTAADEAVVVLQENTTNSLSDGPGYTGDQSDADAPNAALFSMADLTLAGTGSLEVKGNSNDGIASKDGLVIQSGTISVTAADDGIRGKDYVILDGGTITVNAQGDGLKSDNETDDAVGYISVNGGVVSVTAGDDGAHAEGDLAVTGGNLTIAQSVEGLEGATVTLAGGATTVTASDDGVNVTVGSTETSGAQQGGPGGGGMQDQASNGAILTISGGTNVITAEGDGLDSNGSVSVTGGTTVVNGPLGNGNGALDANGSFVVDGGTLIAAGSSGMAEAPDAESTTGWVSIGFSSPVTAGQSISVVSGDTVIATYTTTKQVSSVVLAADGITTGESYDIYSGSSLAETKVGTFSLGGSITGATKLGTVTAGEHTATRGGR